MTWKPDILEGFLTATLQFTKKGDKKTWVSILGETYTLSISNILSDFKTIKWRADTLVQYSEPKSQQKTGKPIVPSANVEKRPHATNAEAL
jgi:hypothetical protein